MFRDLYKQSSCEAERQESRRQRLLQEQKRRRLQLQDEQRILETVTWTKGPRSRRTFKENYHIDVTLQLSEWMRERPEDLDDWFLVPCPKGQRCLVIASGGRTEMYNKAGRRCMKFHTILPGDGVANRAVTMLDCILVQTREGHTFHVLDALAYGNQDFHNCEAQFRFFWLRSKFEENEELGVCNVRNEKRFSLIKRYDCENMECISMALERYPLWADNSPPLDGLLFYHKQASYTCGRTPLVGWLYPYMVPELLGLTVSMSYEAPPGYMGAHQYMDVFDEKLALKKNDRRLRDVEMSENDHRSEREMEEIDTSDVSLENILNDEKQLEEEGVN